MRCKGVKTPLFGPYQGLLHVFDRYLSAMITISLLLPHQRFDITIATITAFFTLCLILLFGIFLWCRHKMGRCSSKKRLAWYLHYSTHLCTSLWLTCNHLNLLKHLALPYRRPEVGLQITISFTHHRSKQVKLIRTEMPTQALRSIIMDACMTRPTCTE